MFNIISTQPGALSSIAAFTHAILTYDWGNPAIVACDSSILDGNSVFTIII